VDDLRLIITQGLGLPYLVPLALDHLEENPLAEGSLYRGDLLMAVAGVDDDYWQGHPDQHVRAQTALRQALSRLEQVSLHNPWESALTEPGGPDAIDRESLEPRIRAAISRMESRPIGRGAQRARFPV
jgi:hypothetical protein